VRNISVKIFIAMKAQLLAIFGAILFVSIDANTGELTIDLTTFMSYSIKFTASCRYYQQSVGYACMLTATITSAEPLSISGSHLSGYGDANVRDIYCTNSNINVLHPAIFQKFPNLVTAYLFRTNVTELLPDSVKGTSLKDIYLYANSIVKIPANVFRGAPNLEGVHLDQNKINFIHQNAFAGLSKLKKLNLNENEIPEVFSETLFPMPSLTELLLGNNRLKNFLPATLSKQINLESLELHANNMMFVFPPIFDSLYKLKKLTLNKNGMNEIPSAVFRNLGRLEHLDIADNSVRRLEVEVFKPLTSLKTLFVDNSGIHTIEKGFLNNLQNLKELRLNSNVCVNQSFANINNINADVAPALANCEGKNYCKTTCAYA